MDVKTMECFRNSSSGKAISSGDLNVPPIRNIPCTSVQVSYCTLQGVKLSH